MNDHFDMYEPTRRSHGSIDPYPNKRQSDYHTQPAPRRSRIVDIMILICVIGILMAVF